MERQETEERFSNDKYIPPVKNRLSEMQLMELEQELEPFKVKKTLEDIFVGEEIEIIDRDAWLKSRNALSKSGAINIVGYVPPQYSVSGKRSQSLDCEPIKYEQCQADLDQFLQWKGKSEFVEKKQIEGYEELSRGMKIDY